MDAKRKKTLFLVLFIILLLPAIQQFLPFVKSGELYGFFPNAKDVSFTLNSWLTDEYQTQKDKFINDNMGFRPDLIRLNNQINYSVYKKISKGHIIEGLNNYLYIDEYIDGYFGKDFIGYSAINKKMLMLKALQDTLHSMGKSLIVVYSPSKEFMYPENIPNKYKNVKKGVTNYEVFTQKGDSLKINQIDFVSYFNTVKNKTKSVLYSKQGIHWAVYGSYIAADSFIIYIEKLRNIKMVHPYQTKLEQTDEIRFPDNDIARTTNLIFPIVKETLSYPTIDYKFDKTTTKPKIIYLGDSFVKIWLMEYLLDNINEDWTYWEYYRGLWTKNSYDRGITDGTTMENYDWQSAIKENDCLVIMYTTSNLPELGNGFIEKAYNYYYPKK